MNMILSFMIHVGIYPGYVNDIPRGQEVMN